MLFSLGVTVYETHRTTNHCANHCAHQCAHQCSPPVRPPPPPPTRRHQRRGSGLGTRRMISIMSARTMVATTILYRPTGRIFVVVVVSVHHHHRIHHRPRRLCHNNFHRFRFHHQQLLSPLPKHGSHCKQSQQISCINGQQHHHRNHVVQEHQPPLPIASGFYRVSFNVG